MQDLNFILFEQFIAVSVWEFAMNVNWEVNFLVLPKYDAYLYSKKLQDNMCFPEKMKHNMGRLCHYYVGILRQLVIEKCFRTVAEKSKHQGQMYIELLQGTRSTALKQPYPIRIIGKLRGNG